MGTILRNTAILTVLMGSLVLLWPAAAHSVMIDLGTLGADYSEATDINERGQIVGYRLTFASGAFHAFLWQDGVMTDLSGIFAAGGINNRGQIVGSSGGRAVLWQDGEITDLGTLGGAFSSAFAINDRGQIVGESSTDSGATHVFLWQDGGMIDLGTLGGHSSVARAINNRGQVVGESNTALGETHPFLWQDGVMIDLGSLHGGFSSRTQGPRTINDRGQVVGFSEGPDDIVT